MTHKIISNFQDIRYDFNEKNCLKQKNQMYIVKNGFEAVKAIRYF